MRLKHAVGMLVVLVLGGGVIALVPPSVSPEAIRSSVVRTEEVLEGAWQLPVAATFKPS
jgi:hypothetical protein